MIIMFHRCLSMPHVSEWEKDDFTNHKSAKNNDISLIFVPGKSAEPILNRFGVVGKYGRVENSGNDQKEHNFFIINKNGKI